MIPEKFEAEYDLQIVEIEPSKFGYTETRAKDELADWLVKDGYDDKGDFYSNFRYLRDVIKTTHEMSQELHKNKEGSMYYLAKIKKGK